MDAVTVKGETAPVAQRALYGNNSSHAKTAGLRGCTKSEPPAKPSLTSINFASFLSAYISNEPIASSIICSTNASGIGEKIKDCPCMALWEILEKTSTSTPLI